MLRRRALKLLLLVAAGVAVPLFAQTRQPPDPVECGSRCGLVPDGHGGYIDCGECTGICGDHVCQPWLGENHGNCSEDCPLPGCVSEGCVGRCGQVRDQCGRLINCGSCPPLCGDSICDPEEWNTCYDDCGPDCTILPSCGLRCGLVDSGCGYFINCGPCGGQCGNGACEAGEGNITCPEDCPPPGCVSTGCNGGCGTYIDNCGQSLACGQCGGYGQCSHPNGICEPELGEDPLSCKWECPIGCDDGICGPGEPLRCPSDCPGVPPPNGISAGAQYSGIVNEPIHFFGLVGPSVNASSYVWYFGDGSTASGLTPVHAYAEAGVYEVLFEVTRSGGGVLRSFTSAAVEGMVSTSAEFTTTLEMYYYADLHGLEAHAAIKHTPAGPTTPKQPYVAMSIFDPSGRVVHESGWVPLVADASPVYVPALSNPTPGRWRARALFSYQDAADPDHRYIFIGRRDADAMVPSAVCDGCLTVSPSDPTLKDGETRGLSGSPNTSSFPAPPDVVLWNASKPSGSSSIGSLEFSDLQATGYPVNVSAHATWFAQPDVRCVSKDVLRAQALTNAKYDIHASIQKGTEVITGQAHLTVAMPWGIGRELNGTEKAAATFGPDLEAVGNPGGVRYSCPNGPDSPCHVTGSSFVRTAPTICWPETHGHQLCDAYKQQYELMPQSSSFRPKVLRHESKHVEQYGPGRYYGDLYTVDGPHGLMSFTVPGKGVALRDLSAPNETQLRGLIDATRQRWSEWTNAEVETRSPGSEPEAYDASDQVPPFYLIEKCNALP